MATSAFFLPMDRIPTVTAQQKGINFDTRRVYTKQTVQSAKRTFLLLLKPHAPKQPAEGPVRLTIDWLFPATKKHPAGSWKTTRPDTDNSVKLLKDCMTELGFWKDDAQVAHETLLKRYGSESGISIIVESL